MRNPVAYVPWEKLYVPPAPDDVPCAGAPAYLFDLAYHGGVNIMRRDKSAPNPAYRDGIGVALRYCATCPLATRAWCVEAVRPALSGVSGVAGGAVWSNGRRIWDVDRQQRLDGQVAA
jgi:hypothetical protein